MKKKVALVMVMLVSVLTLSACSQTQTGFYSKLKQSNSWEASSVELKGNVSVSSSVEESIEMGITANGYLNNTAKQGFFEFLYTDSSDSINIPNIKMYLDNTDFYINKDYFTGLSSPDIAAKFNSIDSQYICLSESNPLLEEIMNKSYDVDSMHALYEQMASKLGIDIPIKQDGNKYTISMNGEQFIDELLKVYDKFVNDLDTFNNDFKLGLTQEDINAIKSSYNKDNVEIYASTFKAMAKNSTMDITYDFKDDTSVDMSMNFNISMLVPINETENMDITVKMNLSGQVKKAELKTIEMPSSSTKLTQQELIELMTISYPAN